MTIQYLVAEFWDCHYELFDSYLTGVSVYETASKVLVKFLVPNIAKAKSQTLLAYKYPNILVQFYTELDLVCNDIYKLLIVNTSHVHSSRESFCSSLEMVKKIRAERCVVICHNKHDIEFCKSVNRNVEPMALSLDSCSYFNLMENNCKEMKVRLYQPYSDYISLGYLESVFAECHKSMSITVAINGMLREGKGFKFLNELKKKAANTRVVVIGSAPAIILKQSGLYQAVQAGLIDRLVCSHARISQEIFIRNLINCDCILDLKPYPSTELRESTSGNLQLSRSLAMPIISHANTYLK
jgi:hypothetical protein